PAPEGPGLFGDPAPVAPPPAAVVPAPAPSGPYRVLARKYRPTHFDDLIGQEALVRTLRNAFAQGRVHHAFLLTGVRGVGKTTTARIIARALNCVGVDGRGGPTADPCGVCPECQAILKDRHPDVVEMDAASNRGIDDVRELREALRFRPAQGRQKVFILDEVHMLTDQAFNALLKSLEEPPPSVTFVLATTELRKVPVTIRSRCQTFSLRRVPVEVLRAHFGRIAEKEGVAVDAEALGMVARAADGSVRDGLSLLDQAIGLAGGGAVTGESVRDMLGLADRFLVFDLMEAVMDGKVADALAILDRTHEVGADPLAVLQDLTDLTHLLTRFRAAPALKDDTTLPEAERTRGSALAMRLSVPTLGRAWQMLLKGIAEVQQEGIDRRAAAEMVLIRLAHVADLPTPGEIVKRLAEDGGGDAAPRPAPGGGSGGLRAMAGGGVVASAAPV
ncbi:DNA polymerase III subunit gamma/tau, partial [Neoroseomonas rubea]|uniref:DNA polymerase III subunit gamma/tau n=1 Tax=Neoroseomonas rubea TaxID=2748666 RepID=UPI001E32AB23